MTFQYFIIIPKITLKTDVSNIDIEYHGLLGIDFLQNYECTIDINNRKLKTKYRDIPQYNEEEIEIEPRVHQILKLKYEHKNVELIVNAWEKES